VTPQDIQYASIYDSFTITVLMQLEDLGFCKKGEGGRFVADGNLISGVGRLPFNTDGGGLCNNHPANRGGITKVIEAVRQLRGEAHPAVQVWPNCQLALAQGMGGLLGSRHGCGTLILVDAPAAMRRSAFCLTALTSASRVFSAFTTARFTRCSACLTLALICWRAASAFWRTTFFASLRPPAAASVIWSMVRLIVRRSGPPRVALTAVFLVVGAVDGVLRVAMAAP
jgi:hypothetical protein